MMAAIPGQSDLEGFSLEDFATEPIHPMLGLHRFQARNLASAINLPYEYWSEFIDIANKLSDCYLASDAATLEINPLAITDERGLVALDARMSIDEYALFRQPDLASLSPHMSNPQNISPMDGIYFIELNGCIGCLTNGSGLGMATMDAIQEFGGDTIRPGCLIDLGNDISEGRLESGLQKILEYPGITVLLVNLFAVVTPCDQTARIILRLLNRIEKKLPVIIRLAGEDANEGSSIIQSANLSHITAVSGFTNAAQKAVDAAKGTNSWLF
jgi:succinyl-CoA synthetase beta subunit